MLTLEQAIDRAPAIGATTPKADVTDRYVFVSTADLIKKFQGNGWEIVKAGQDFSREEVNATSVRHMVTMVNPSLPKVNGSQAALSIVNSHNRTARLSAFLTIYRQVCGNGMHAPCDLFQRLTMKHLGEGMDEAIDALEVQVVEQAPAIINNIEKWSSVTLTSEEKVEFAKLALACRWGSLDENKELVVNAPVKPEQLLIARRIEDKLQDNLFTTSQIVQESIVRGDMRGRTSTGRRTTVKNINSVDKNIKTNQLLFALTDAVANQKLFG